MEITAVILTKNEEKDLKRVLNSVYWCNEILVIDDNSTDDTVKIAKEFNARVLTHALEKDFSQQRNFALQNASTKWVLFVDADEVVSKELQEEIKERIQTDSVKGFYLKRRDTWMGKEMRYGEGGSNYLLRLARKGSGTWARRVHEVWDVNGKVEKLHGVLFHYPHPLVSDFINHINFHSTIHSEENFKEGKKSDLVKIMIYPPGKFIYNFFAKGAVLDGYRGFVYSLLMSFHSFLAWSKLWFIQKRQKI